MHGIRFIRTGYNYADFSTSISPAIERALEKRESFDTVVLNIFDGDSFTVGYFDDPEKSMDLDFCRRENIIVRRRQNAGGAVIGADGCAFLALYLNTDGDRVPMKTIRTAFEKTLTLLAESISELFDIEAVYRPLNDVEVNGRKLVASSARLEKKILTVRCMINVCPTDRDVLTRAIKVAPEKIQDKKIKEVGKRFTCLEEETLRKVTDKELLILTERTVGKIFGTQDQLVPMTVSSVEETYARTGREKYESDEWFYANSEGSRFKHIPETAVKREGRHKAVAGLIRATVLIIDDSIHDIIITGDFHPTPNSILTEMENSLRNKPCDPDIIEKAVQAIFDRPDVEIAGTTPADFLAALDKVLR
jgi:lipoate---protein ligase